MQQNKALDVQSSCGCFASTGGCGCGCDGSCGCGDASRGRKVEEQIAELEQAKRNIDERLVELQRS